jgi:DnaJ-class molecular chaperone
MSDFAVPNATPGRCAKCNGSGQYRWAGKLADGRPVVRAGSCHSCGGSGRQSRSDIARNNAYNRHKLASLGGI